MQKKILVIDDDPNLVRLVEYSLTQEGYEVYKAYDGQEGMRQMYSHQPDLVILDIMMPKMDGWEVCQQIRRQSSVPIIMLTAKTEDTDVIYGLDKGADEYVTKPFSVEVLLARVEAVLRRVKLERESAQADVQELQQLAYHDPLTGLPNRTLFNDRLALALSQAHRNQQKLAVIMLDLDGFKDVNDTLGHSMGDELLQAVGDRLTSLLRQGDTVARMGGDEFMMLLPEITGGEAAAQIAQKILEAFREPFVFDGHRLHITTSIGIALYPNDGEDGDTLTKSADIAMYRAKEEGRGSYQRYTPAMKAKALERPVAVA